MEKNVANFASFSEASEQKTIRAATIHLYTILTLLGVSVILCITTIVENWPLWVGISSFILTATGVILGITAQLFTSELRNWFINHTKRANIAAAIWASFFTDSIVVIVVLVSVIIHQRGALIPSSKLLCPKTTLSVDGVAFLHCIQDSTQIKYTEQWETQTLNKSFNCNVSSSIQTEVEITALPAGYAAPCIDLASSALLKNKANYAWSALMKVINGTIDDGGGVVLGVQSQTPNQSSKQVRLFIQESGYCDIYSVSTEQTQGANPFKALSSCGNAITMHVGEDITITGIVTNRTTIHMYLNDYWIWTGPILSLQLGSVGVFASTGNSPQDSPAIVNFSNFKLWAW